MKITKTLLKHVIKLCIKEVLLLKKGPKDMQVGKFSKGNLNIYQFTDGKSFGDFILKEKDFFDKNYDKPDKMLLFIAKHCEDYLKCSIPKVKLFVGKLHSIKDAVKRLQYIYNFYLAGAGLRSPDSKVKGK